MEFKDYLEESFHSDPDFQDELESGIGARFNIFGRVTIEPEIKILEREKDTKNYKLKIDFVADAREIEDRAKFYGNATIWVQFKSKPRKLGKLTLKQIVNADIDP